MPSVDPPVLAGLPDKTGPAVLLRLLFAEKICLRWEVSLPVGIFGVVTLGILLLISLWCEGCSPLAPVGFYTPALTLWPGIRHYTCVDLTNCCYSLVWAVRGGGPWPGFCTLIQIVF